MSVAKKPAEKKKERKKERFGDVLFCSGKAYEIVSLLGSGGFADVYKVRLTKIKDKQYALKTERFDCIADKKGRRMRVEIAIYTAIQDNKDYGLDKSHFVRMLESGKTDDFAFIIMDIVGPSLVDIREKMMGGRTSPRTIAEIASQTLRATEALHELGFLNRDIKPHNFAVGLPPRDTIIFMLDLGIARPYRENDGRLRPPRPKVRWLGTIRYASARGLSGEDQSRRDDLEQWCFMMLEYYHKRNMLWSFGQHSMQLIIGIKSHVMTKSAAMRAKGHLKMPARFSDILTMVSQLSFSDQPDYKGMQAILEKITKDEKIDMTVPLDWIGKAMPAAKEKGDKDAGEGQSTGRSAGYDKRETQRKKIEEELIKAYKVAGIVVPLAKVKEECRRHERELQKRRKQRRNSQYEDSDSEDEEDSERSEDDDSEDEESRPRRRKHRNRRRSTERREDSDRDRRGRRRSDEKKRKRKKREVSRVERRPEKDEKRFTTASGWSASYPYKDKKELVYDRLTYIAKETAGDNLGSHSLAWSKLTRCVDLIRSEAMLDQIFEMLERWNEISSEKLLKEVEDLVKYVPKEVTKQMVKKSLEDVGSRTRNGCEGVIYCEIVDTVDRISNQEALSKMWVALQNWDELGDKETLDELGRIFDRALETDNEKQKRARQCKEKGKGNGKEKDPKKEKVDEKKITVDTAKPYFPPILIGAPQKADKKTDEKKVGESKKTPEKEKPSPSKAPPTQIKPAEVTKKEAIDTKKK